MQQIMDDEDKDVQQVDDEDKEDIVVVHDDNDQDWHMVEHNNFPWEIVGTTGADEVPASSEDKDSGVQVIYIYILRASYRTSYMTLYNICNVLMSNIRSLYIHDTV